MPLGDVHIMMFYGHLVEVSLTHSIKFITITFLKHSSAKHHETKTIEVIQYLINFEETS